MTNWEREFVADAEQVMMMMMMTIESMLIDDEAYCLPEEVVE